MLYKQLNSGNQHRVEFEENMQGVLLLFRPVIGSNAGRDQLNGVKISVKITSPGNQEIVIANKVPVNQYGMLTGRDGNQNNQWNINIRPTKDNGNDQQYLRMINLTTDGNLNLLEGEKIIMEIENAGSFNVDVRRNLKTYITDTIMCMESTFIREQEQKTFITSRYHAVLLDYNTLSSDITFKHESNAVIEKDTTQLRYEEMTQDFCVTMEISQYDNYNRNLRHTDPRMIIDCTGIDPIKSMKFDQTEGDHFITACILKKREGNKLTDLPRK